MEPVIKTACCGSVYVYLMHFRRAGHQVRQHVHSYDHLLLLSSGSLRVNVEGQDTDYVAPRLIAIAKHRAHGLVALEDNTVAACVAARPGNDDDVVLDPEMLPAGIAFDFFGVRTPVPAPLDTAAQG